MNTLQTAKRTISFEQTLLSYVEMCYGVALALTRNPEDARNLTRETLVCVWHLRDRADAQSRIKETLLKVLRERFLQFYRHTPTLRNQAVLAEMA